jgi:hypothetical protein
MRDHAAGDRIRGYVRGRLPRSLEALPRGLLAVIHLRGGVRRDLVTGITVGAVTVPASPAFSRPSRPPSPPSKRRRGTADNRTSTQRLPQSNG